MIKQISIPPLESILPTTRKVDEAGQTRRTLPIFQTFFSIENEEEGSTFGKHELDCRPFDPPCRPRPSDREFFIFLLKTCWKESNRVDRGEEDTLYGKMFHGDRCKSASIPFPSPPSGEDTSDTYEKGGWATLFPRTTGWPGLLRTKLYVSVVRIWLPISEAFRLVIIKEGMW